MDELQFNIQLLVASASSGNANRLISALRESGASLRALIAENSQVLSAHLQQQCDVVVCYPSPELTISNVLQVLERHNQSLPVILVSAPEEADLLALYRQGVRHVQNDQTALDLQQLQLSVMREAQASQRDHQLRELQLRQHELVRRHDLLLDDSVTAYSYLQDGMHVYCNNSYAQLFGYDSTDSVRTTPLMNMVTVKDRSPLREVFSQDHPEPCKLTLQGRRQDGSEQSLLFRFSPVEYQGTPCMLLAVHPAAGNAQYQAEVERLQSHDLLTRVENAAPFLNRIEAAIGEAVHKHQTSALLVFEVNDFRELSDSLGKASTNILLNDIAQYLQQSSLPHSAARLGEHEFGLLVHASDPDQILQLANSLQEGFTSRISAVLPASLEISCAIGATMVNSHCLNASDTLARARHNLKSQDAGLAPTYSFRIGDSLEHDSATMLSFMQQALAEQRFRLLYQPIVHIKGPDHLGYEVLMRMLDTDGNEVPPGAFLPLANLNGMGELLDREVIGRVLQTLQSATAGLRLILNITSNTLMSKTFLPWLSEQLQVNRTPTSRLIIELSEIDIHKSFKQAMRFCQGLEELGLPLSISHFGCALNPFGILDSIKPAFLKLDDTIVRDIIYSTHQKASIRVLVAQIHQRGLLVVIPHAEDMDVLPILWEIGVDYAQGYCLQAPSNEMNYEFMTEEELTLTASQH